MVWVIFTAMLKYKTELTEKQLVKIDKFYPSKSKLLLKYQIYTG